MGYNEGLNVKINTKKSNRQETIAGPRPQRGYVTYFNALKNNYHNSSFYSTTIRKFLTTLESSAGQCTVLFTLSLLLYDTFPNWLLVRVNGRSISVETMAAMTFKLIFPFL